MNLQETLRQPANLPLARRLMIANGVVSTVVLLLVGAMREIRIPLPEGVGFSFLPPVYSIINSLVAVLLVVAVVMIRRGNVMAHRRAINTAMLGSLLFLVCYVVYHLTTDPTRYGGTGVFKMVYFVLLISHVVLAAVSLPFILTTWIYGFTNQFEKHRRLAKFVFPVWLYVAVSGPICYLMLRPYYFVP
jgi:putative membrane protein